MDARAQDTNRDHPHNRRMHNNISRHFASPVPSPTYPPRPPYSLLRMFALKIFPIFFFIHFVEFGTAILIYTLAKKKPMPRKYVIGSAGTFGIILVLIAGSHWLLYCRTRCQEDRHADVEGERCSRSGSSESGCGLSLCGMVLRIKGKWESSDVGSFLVKYEERSHSFERWREQLRREAEMWGREDSPVMEIDRNPQQSGNAFGPLMYKAEPGCGTERDGSERGDRLRNLSISCASQTMAWRGGGNGGVVDGIGAVRGRSHSRASGTQQTQLAPATMGESHTHAQWGSPHHSNVEVSASPKGHYDPYRPPNRPGTEDQNSKPSTSTAQPQSRSHPRAETSGPHGTVKSYSRVPYGDALPPHPSPKTVFPEEEILDQNHVLIGRSPVTEGQPKRMDIRTSPAQMHKPVPSARSQSNTLMPTRAWPQQQYSPLPIPCNPGPWRQRCKRSNTSRDNRHSPPIPSASRRRRSSESNAEYSSRPLNEPPSAVKAVTQLSSSRPANPTDSTGRGSMLTTATSLHPRTVDSITPTLPTGSSSSALHHVPTFRVHNTPNDTHPPALTRNAHSTLKPPPDHHRNIHRGKPDKTCRLWRDDKWVVLEDDLREMDATAAAAAAALPETAASTRIPTSSISKMADTESMIRAHGKGAARRLSGSSVLAAQDEAVNELSSELCGIGVEECRHEAIITPPVQANTSEGQGTQESPPMFPIPQNEVERPANLSEKAPEEIGGGLESERSESDEVINDDDDDIQIESGLEVSGTPGSAYRVRSVSLGGWMEKSLPGCWKDWEAAGL